MLARLLGAKRPVMMLARGRFRVAHLSTHLPLRKALRRVRRERILYVIRLFAEALEALDGRPPRLAVAGLNPHAGEGGLFGREEIEEIAPAIRRARGEGRDVAGPEPPDTVFAKLRGGLFDGVVAMYHDQGHIAGKLMCFRFDAQGRGAVRGVNVTLGLPIVRTSVEHGTAFEIAGRGRGGPLQHGGRGCPRGEDGAREGKKFRRRAENRAGLNLLPDPDDAAHDDVGGAIGGF